MKQRNILAVLCISKFEEVHSVTIFTKIEKDSNGLNLYTCMCGTVRTEISHQKMKATVGLWSVGVKFAYHIWFY